MNKRKEAQERGKYTLEFKLKAVRLVKGAGDNTTLACVPKGHRLVLENGGPCVTK